MNGRLPFTLSLVVGTDPQVDSCPCGRAQNARSCCRTADGRWTPPRLTIRRDTARTGKQVRGCYAAALHDCEGVLSREHYIPEAVIRLISDAPVMEGVSGRRIVGARNMVVKVLCQRHNALLSPLDSLNKVFVERLRSFFPLMPRSNHLDGDATVLFHGDDIGRVMLKTLCAIEAGALDLGAAHQPARDWTPPSHWLGILFDDAPWPQGWGLHVPVMLAGLRPDAGGIAVGRRVTQEGEIIGGELVVAGLQFLLLMGTVPEDAWGEPSFSSVHPQPARVIVHVAGARKTVEFGWDRDRDRVTVNHRISSSRPSLRTLPPPAQA